MVRGRARGVKGSLCPPPPPHHHPNSPHLDPPPQPTLPEPPPQPLLDPPPICPSLTPPPPPPPPKGASGQQLVLGVVGVQNRGVAPPGVWVSFFFSGRAGDAGGGWGGCVINNPDRLKAPRPYPSGQEGRRANAQDVQVHVRGASPPCWTLGRGSATFGQLVAAAPPRLLDI